MHVVLFTNCEHIAEEQSDGYDKKSIATHEQEKNPNKQK